MNYQIIPVILCGGKGTRLWPLSRNSYPKQFLKINDKSFSLLQKTIKRILNLEDVEKPIIICNEEHRFLVAEQMREIDISSDSIILEPIGRNTAPAITLAALCALKRYKNPILLILSSDHEIRNETKFLEIIQKGILFAEKNKLVTFGVVPTSPETGYGYIKAKEKSLERDFEVRQISKFIEKPKFEKAQKYILDKRYTWNSGMFAFKATTIIKELNNHYPEIIKFCEQSINKSQKDLDFTRIDKTFFEKCPNISIDIAVMEKTSLGIVLPINIGWSDIGSWKSVWENSDKDNNNNSSTGEVILKESYDSLIKSESRLVVAIGIKNLIVVETRDAILVADKERTQMVKNIVSEMNNKGYQEGINHQTIYRPWGHYTTMIKEKHWQVKLIVVKPEQQLSLQLHNHRSEHWVVVNGIAKVEINEKILSLSENQSTYIPLGAKHRLSNPGELPLSIIEIQSGEYIGEDDIIRFEDRYGRSNKNFN